MSSCRQAFDPIFTEAFDACGLSAAWSVVSEGWDSIPSIPMVWEKPEMPEVDIKQYAMQKAIDGLFVLVAEKEVEIRANPGGAAAAAVQEVFAQFM